MRVLLRAKRAERGPPEGGQRIKHYYGLHERQLARLFELATRTATDPANGLLVLCERRLDNAVRRAGYARTRRQARQGVALGHFLVNGRRVDVASYLVRAGDVVSVAPRQAVQAFYRGLLADGLHNADWLASERETLAFTVTRLPTAEDSSLPADVTEVIEPLTR